MNGYELRALLADRFLPALAGLPNEPYALVTAVTAITDDLEARALASHDECREIHLGLIGSQIRKAGQADGRFR